ncbi:MAG: glycosyltransferase [Pyrinomonadaceae bacterium]|nr:glycosyltransferase [Pyrinomonadaceae bacterium]
MFTGKSIICFGGEDFWYHHPHPSEHLMRRFARAGNKVIFVNSISMGLPSLAHKDLLPRIRRKLRSYARFAREAERNLTVVSPPVVPFFGSRAGRAANQLLLSAQINLLARRKDFTRPVLWIAIPTAVDMIGRVDESLVVYLVTDKYDANTMDHATEATHITRLHERALEASDIILYSGRKLFDEATIARERSHLLEHAIDYEHFAQVSSKELEVPEAVARIPRPHLGYFGAMEEWLIDEELVEKISRERPLWQWVFIGNCARGMKIGELENVHILPPVAYADLPRYASGFDVCVLPWNTHNTWTTYASPMKVREYLATGKPTVIVDLYEFEHLRDVLRIAHSHDGFLRLTESALKETGEDAARARQGSIAHLTWDNHAEAVSCLIEGALAEKKRS